MKPLAVPLFRDGTTNDLAPKLQLPRCLPLGAMKPRCKGEGGLVELLEYHKTVQQIRLVAAAHLNCNSRKPEIASLGRARSADNVAGVVARFTSDSCQVLWKHVVTRRSWIEQKGRLSLARHVETGYAGFNICKPRPGASDFNIQKRYKVERRVLSQSQLNNQAIACKILRRYIFCAANTAECRRLLRLSNACLKAEH